MPKWINCAERLPNDDWQEDYPKEYLVRAKGDDPRSGWIDTDYLPYDDILDFMKLHEYCQWLDEEDNTPSFSIEDMRACWDKCDYEHSDRSGCSLPKNMFNKFIKEYRNP